MSRSAGSTTGRVTRDPCQISIATGGCVTRDCRFERKSTVFVTRRLPALHSLSQHLVEIVQHVRHYVGDCYGLVTPSDHVRFSCALSHEYYTCRLEAQSGDIATVLILSSEQEACDLLITDIFPRGTYPPNKAGLTQRRELGHQFAKQLSLTTAHVERASRFQSTRPARLLANQQQPRWKANTSVSIVHPLSNTCNAILSWKNMATT
jgi:hypothetical protein